MKIEKEIFCEFVGLIFYFDKLDSKDVFFKINLMKGLLILVCMVVNDVLEMCLDMLKLD